MRVVVMVDSDCCSGLDVAVDWAAHFRAPKRKGGWDMIEFKCATRELAVLVAGLTFMLLPAGGVNAADDQADREQELRILLAENKLLKSTIEARDKEIAAIKAELAELKTEIARLKAGVPQSQPAGEPEAPAPAKITYLGRERSLAWLEDAFEKYAGNLVICKDTVFDTGKLRAKEQAFLLTGRVMPNLIESNPPEVGAFQGTTGKILQVINGCELLVQVSELITDEPITIHIKGIDATNLTDGATLAFSIVQYLGPYTYESAAGAKRTVQSYEFARTVTKDEFVLVLSKGFKLVEYKPVKVTPNYRNKNWQDNLIGHGSTWYKITEKPVP